RARRVARERPARGRALVLADPLDSLSGMAVIAAGHLRDTSRTTTGISRRRALAVEAVRGVSFEVGQGELFGLLGPNGAGKTTTIKMLITLLLPRSRGAMWLGSEVGT